MWGNISVHFRVKVSRSLECETPFSSQDLIWWNAEHLLKKCWILPMLFQIIIKHHTLNKQLVTLHCYLLIKISCYFTRNKNPHSVEPAGGCVQLWSSSSTSSTKSAQKCQKKRILKETVENIHLLLPPLQIFILVLHNVRLESISVCSFRCMYNKALFKDNITSINSEIHLSHPDKCTLAIPELGMGS